MSSSRPSRPSRPSSSSSPSSSLTRGRVAKTPRGKRALESRAPKLVEPPKVALLLKGNKTSGVCIQALKDLGKLKQPFSRALKRHNSTHPFDDISSVEYLCTSNDAPMFLLSNHSKKRPHNFIFGRMFDNQMIDLFEFGVDPDTFQPLTHFDSIRKATVRYASKPLLIFQGSAFDLNADLVRFKSYMLDLFRQEEMDKINLAALDRVLILTANDNGKVAFRHYGIALKKSGSRLPRVELDECGPRIDFTLRRRKEGDQSLVKEAMKQPKKQAATGYKSPTQKNIETGRMGERRGRIHMKRQNLENVNIANMKGLKRRKSQSENGNENESETPEGKSAQEGEYKRRSNASGVGEKNNKKFKAATEFD